MKHYVVILDWSTESESDVLVIGVGHSYEEAKAIFNGQIENEKDITKENDWYVYTDDKDCFEAGVYGRWDEGHTHLFIQEVT